MDNKKGLGRGLGSLLGIFDDRDDILEENVTNNKVSDKKLDVDQIEIGLIDNNPGQPRKNFDPTTLKELSQSIKEHGVIQPIILAPRGSRYIIVAGERRFRASQMAGLKTIPAVVRDYTNDQIKEIALLENIQREDLNPIETAKAMQELLDDFGWTQEVLADRLGKSRPAVANTLRLLSLCPEVIELIRNGKLSSGHARALVIITDPEVQLKLAKLAVTKKLTVRDMEKAVKEQTQPKAQKKKQVHSAELNEFVNTMQHKFGTKVSVLGTDKRGRIYIDYYSEDDLDRIYSLINKL